MEHDESKDMITFDLLCNTYIEAGSFASPSELHGQLCGHLSVGDQLEASAILSITSAQVGTNVILNESMEATVLMLYQEIRQQLKSPDLSFFALLPDNSEPLSVRLECLSQWCHGFLIGYSSIRIKETSLTEDEHSIILDFTQIVKVDIHMGTTDDDQCEQDYMLLYDYVRTSAMMLCHQNSATQ